MLGLFGFCCNIFLYFLVIFFKCFRFVVVGCCGVFWDGFLVWLVLFFNIVSIGIVIMFRKVNFEVMMKVFCKIFLVEVIEKGKIFNNNKIKLGELDFL